MEGWRLLRIGSPYDPHYNLAVEEAIAQALDCGSMAGTIRFWRNANAVVVGRFQCVANEVDIGACTHFGTRIVRRFTGGGAVYHDLGNLNYSVVVARASHKIGENPAQAFHTVGQVIESTLRLLGIDAQFVPENQIDVHGRKISGMAATMLKGTMLVHGSLLVYSDLERMSQVLSKNSKFPSKYTQSQRRPVTRITDELQQNVGIESIEELLRSSFEEMLDIELLSGQLSHEEKVQARSLYESKYATREWQLGECLPCVNSFTETGIHELASLCFPVVGSPTN